MIGRNILKNIGDLIQGDTAVIVTDSNVDRLYADKVCDSLSAAGKAVYKYVFAAGESSKNFKELEAILNYFSEVQLTRSDTVIALGGGVVGDLAGFGAAVYLRGVRLVQVPTTLLAAVDSSIGGKTAVNLSSGKNLAGAFIQPSLVLCDIDTLDTLSPEIFSDGCAEVIKYGIIKDFNVINMLDKRDIEAVVKRCVEIKNEIVSFDERDYGIRHILNFGHTIGHAIEKLSGYKTLHGYAVAAGMVMMAKIGYRLGVCSANLSDEIAEINTRYNLPTGCDYRGEQLFQAMLSDKKRSGDSINLVLPTKIGDCVLNKVTIDELRKLIIL